MPRAKTSASQKPAQDKTAKAEINVLKKQLQELKAAHKKELNLIKTEIEAKMYVAAEAAYDAGFNDALDELENFTQARDKYLLTCEAKFEKDYAAQLSKKAAGKKTKKTAKKKTAKKATKKKA